MKWHVAFVSLAFVAPSLALTFVEAYDRAYAYVVYDQDVIVWGHASVAPQRDIAIGRHLKNVEMVLGAVSLSRAAQLNSKTLSLLRSNVKNVIWQIVEKESAFVDNKWNEIDWNATIKKNPNMSKPSSSLFKEVTAGLRSLHRNNAAEMAARQKVMDMVHLCFGA
ncbi:hypothetical protein EDB81DRAFT_764090 [Dactylonectria macrodidyma]|uniref:Uncharacterized protein n=1 Tax=Dactylonectria macrodidyma TaxID=307937 RepID=A0A9P9E1I5_9HYPO|nr:hypothetical protein EDB81DRAFT_764090 [Dactylonectria macrodidyma]